MADMDYLVELNKQLRSGQEKYDYWLMAVAASAIALAVNQTRDQPLHLAQIPLGLAVIAWGLSFFAGCTMQLWTHSALHANFDRVKVERGTHPRSGTDPAKIALSLESLDKIIEEKNTKISCWGRVQFSALVLGALLYLTWHIIEMWLRT